MKLFTLVIYFIFTIVLLGNIGTLLPIAIDYFPENSLSEEAQKTLPGNLLTYYLNVFFVASIDRIRKILKDEDYKYKELEVLLFGLVVLCCLTIAYFSFSKIYQKQYDSAIDFCLWGTLLAYIVWWIANYKTEKVDPYGAFPKA